MSSSFPTEEGKLKGRIAKQLTNAAYSQSNYKPNESDYSGLTDDLYLVEANFYPKDFVLTYQAKKNYPDSDITVQLNYKFNIAEVTVR